MKMLSYQIWIGKIVHETMWSGTYSNWAELEIDHGLRTHTYTWGVNYNDHIQKLLCPKFWICKIVHENYGSGDSFNIG